MAATSGKQWKNTVEITLPSGYTVEMRPLGYDLILKCDHVPDVITALVVRAFKGDNAGLEVNEFKQAQEYVEFLDTCCELCFVSPKVVQSPEGEDEISTDDIEFDDKVAVFGFLGKSRRWLELFRSEQIANVQALAEKSVVSHAAESTPQPETTPA